MAFNFTNLTPQVRNLMLDEVLLDEKNGNLYKGSYTNDLGKMEFPKLLINAIREGNEVTLAASLHRGLFLGRYEKRKRDGSIFTASVPEDANRLLAEGEFNRFYVRAICRLAIMRDILEVRIYRARSSDNPRPESEARIGALIGAQALLSDLRNSQGVGTALGCPSGPRSGLSIMLPDLAGARLGSQEIST